MSDNSRRYTDEEFSRVLHHALQLQERAATGKGGRQHGLTLEEMKAAARDVGIDPELVERAVALLPQKRSITENLMGGPARYRLSYTAPARAEADQLTQVVDMIRAEVGITGRVSSEFDGVTWETEGEVSQIHVALFPRAERTEVRVSVNRDAALILTWFGSLAGGIVAAGITGAIIDPAVTEGVLIMGSGTAGGLALARLLWQRSTRIIRERADRLMAVIGRELKRGS
jgi:hypothetical protein